METVPATSYASPAATVHASGGPSRFVATSRPDVAAEATTRCDGQPWTFRNGFDRVLRRVPLSAWQNPQLQGWERIKENARREVWRARIGPSVYYLKYYARQGWTARLRELFRRGGCEAEWRGGVYALRAGIAAVGPAGYTAGLRRNGRTFALLVTEAVARAYPLDEFWQQIQADDDVRRRRRDTAQVVELLGELIARAHQGGFEHLDMHAANILIQPVAAGRYRALFVDLQSARLGVPIRDRAVVRNLAQLNQWFRRHSSLSQRLRFLRAYLRWRHEYETTSAYGRPLNLSFRQLVRALARAADRHAGHLWAQRDRRACREGRYFARLRLPGGWHGLVTVQCKHPSEDSPASHLLLDRRWWVTQLTNPLRWFAPTDGHPCKNSHSAFVCRALLPHHDGHLPAIVKRPLPRNGWRRLVQMLPPSRSMRGWRLGHALLNRNLAAARPLAILERRLGPLVLDHLLITEAIPGAVDLESHLRSEIAVRPPAAWARHKAELSELLVRHLRRLEERGFTHRDCKASNILVRALPQPRLFWIDMDGLRATLPGRAARQHLRPLVRLHASLLRVPGLTRTDRVRFLRSYCARWGTGPDEWRTLWRVLEPLVGRKIRANEARRRWKLAHYGRE